MSISAERLRDLMSYDAEKHSFPYHPTWQLRYLDALRSLEGRDE